MRPFSVRGAEGQLCGVEVCPEHPQGRPILLIHGVNMSLDVWAEVQQAIGSKRWVICFDLRGHGSSGMSGPFEVDDYALDVLTVLDALQVERAHLVGVSFGGSIACAVAGRSPDQVASVASFGGMLVAKDVNLDLPISAIRQSGVRSFFESLLPNISFAPGTDTKLIERALASAVDGRSIDTVIEVLTAAFTTDVTAIARSISVPALVVTGELDLTCPVDSGAAVADSLNTEHVVVPGKGHVLPMEAPDIVTGLILQHTNRVDAKQIQECE